MGLLTREQILAVQDVSTETVAVPEWGGDVLVRGMTGTERDRFEASIVETHGKKVKVVMVNIRARLVAQCVIDEKGERLFSNADIELLGKKSAAALQRVYDVAQKLCGLSDSDVEELSEAFLPGPSGASTSD